MSTQLYTKINTTYFQGNLIHEVTTYSCEADLPCGTLLSQTLSCLGEGKWCYLLNVEGALLLTDGCYNIPITPENEVEYVISTSGVSLYIEMTDRLICRPISTAEKFARLGEALARGSAPVPETFFEPCEPMEVDEEEEAVEALSNLVDAESQSPLDSSQAETPEESEPEEVDEESEPEEEN